MYRVLCGILVIGLGTTIAVDPFHHTAGELRPVPADSHQAVALDCGAASLYVILRLQGESHPLPYLREITKTNAFGTTMFDIKNAAESLGLTVGAYRLSFSGLTAALAQPKSSAILFLTRGHFVSAVGTSPSGAVTILDSSLGIICADRSQLEQSMSWAGDCLLFSPKSTSP